MAEISKSRHQISNIFHPKFRLRYSEKVRNKWKQLFGNCVLPRRDHFVGISLANMSRYFCRGSKNDPVYPGQEIQN
ncbi:MAG: hypothetical protein EA359_03290 [Balneolaceae bacterium]|nr:MAG: hypothetical protein EA359_03290 [Balneolaceae bacterium]